MVERARCDLISLYGEHVEQPSVPTMFVSSPDALDTLPEDLRKKIDGLVAIRCWQMTYGVDGMAPEESAALLEALFRHSYAPGRELAHHWREVSIIASLMRIRTLPAPALWGEIQEELACAQQDRDLPAHTLFDKVRRYRCASMTRDTNC